MLARTHAHAHARNATGLSVISGQRCTYITPVYCGHALDYLTQTVPIGGQEVTTVFNSVRAHTRSLAEPSPCLALSHV
jgi:actin-related protein